MIGLLQRVSEARVEVNAQVIGEIGAGLLVLVGVERDDTAARADRLLERILGLRVFPDPAGRMNISLATTAGDLLLVPQFTLAADTRKGTRPSFTPAADAERGQELFDYLVDRARETRHRIATGSFGAHMRVALVNDGPVTFTIHT